jgi:hypothetical protein
LIFIALSLSAHAAVSEVSCAADGSGALHMETSLLQVSQVKNPNRHAETSCVPLKNTGTCSTVRVQVGTPPQIFDLVADTGSNALLVESCICQSLHQCGSGDKCFEFNKSSSASLTHDAAGNVSQMLLSYGSGDIRAIVTTDVVRVGKVEAELTDSVMLMVTRNLDFGGPFEGILGLGTPQADEWSERGFLEFTSDRRFSMCFNSDSDGVLRLPPSPATIQHGSLGQVHWGLGLEGVSVGDTKMPFCLSENMTSGQETPCGAIPDSGTTLILAPIDHITELYAQLCSSWSRCHSVYSGNNSVGVLANALAFELLLKDCSSWLTEQGLDELPELTFNVLGSNGTTQELKIPGSAYILRSKKTGANMTEVTYGFFSINGHDDDDAYDGICMAAFSEYSQTTVLNGPVWILGTPFFYQYQVGFDMLSNPPSISFTDEPCGSCDERGTVSHRPSLLSHSRARSIETAPRRPTWKPSSIM